MFRISVDCKMYLRMLKRILMGVEPIHDLLLLVFSSSTLPSSNRGLQGRIVQSWVKIAQD